MVHLHPACTWVFAHLELPGQPYSEKRPAAIEFRSKPIRALGRTALAIIQVSLDCKILKRNASPLTAGIRELDPYFVELNADGYRGGTNGC